VKAAGGGGGGGGSGEALAVFVHGWSSDGGRMAPLAGHVLDAGISCLLVDLPGHGRTGRTTGYNAALMVEDLRALADYVSGRPDLASAPAALVGYSFGGIGAIVSAATHKRWAALVVMATPAGPMAATEIYLEGRGIPARRLRKPLRRAATRIVGIDPGTFDGDRHLPALDVPVLFVHGTEDGVVPHGHAEALYGATPRERAEILLIEGADHDGLLAHPEAGRQVAAFLGRALRG
jgi:pimeloyl-ACP methyl ester carboxylesterase